jgi:Putative amidase domain
MFHPSSSPDSFSSRYRLAGLLLALLLACGALFSLGGMAYASSAAQQVRAQEASPDVTNAAVTFANHHWNCWTAACTRSVKQGQGQPYYECAEFVARSLATEGFMPGLRSTSPQSAYGSYKPKGQKVKYDLLLITPLRGYHTLADYLKAYGDFKNVGHKVGDAEPGDVVVFEDSSGTAQHTALITKSNFSKASIRVDAHNNARYGYALTNYLKEFPKWYILHYTYPVD